MTIQLLPEAIKHERGADENDFLATNGLVKYSFIDTKDTNFILTKELLNTDIIINPLAETAIVLPETATESIEKGAKWYVTNNGSFDAYFVKEGSDVIIGNTLLAPGATAKVIKIDGPDVNFYRILGGTSFYIFPAGQNLTGQIDTNTYRIGQMFTSGTVLNIITHLRSGSATIFANGCGISGNAMTHAQISNVSPMSSSIFTPVTAGGEFKNGDYITATISSAAAPQDLAITFECLGRL